ncbi:alcohol dehydrogenase catalytic domain-containing protein [bacterium]|nr:alcohol dehydrogenase catalytic domain-containing protein [bacterium]
MSDTMKAVVYRGPGEVAVEAMPVPICGDGEIRVKIDACAVCGTDLKSYVHGNPKITPPRIIGHEFTGIVDTVGANARGFAVGDRIVMATSVSCGECAYCARGWTNLCVDMAAMGFKYEGGMAEYTVVPDRALRNGHAVKVPDGVAPEHAALAEPVSCAVNAAENCQIQQGDTVVVVGAGPMGIINACVARECGAARIIVAEINATRLAMCEPFGFERLVNPISEDLVQIVKDATDGLGADVAIVAAPAAQPQEQAIDLVRKRGCVCLFASLPKGQSALTIDSRPLHYNELRMVGTSDSTPAHVAQAVELIAGGSLPVDKLASHILSLDDIEQAYALMKSGESLRVVLKP